MNHYCQHDYKDQLGSCNETISSAGCFVTSLAMLGGKTPPEVNNLFKDRGGYSNGCLVNCPSAAEILGLPYSGIIYSDPHKICIAETSHYKSSGYPQHFLVWLGNGEIHDPLLSYGPTVNNYKIVSYRLFEPKGEPMDDKEGIELVRDVRRYVGGKEPTDATINADMANIKGRQSPWKYSGWFDDRKAEIDIQRHEELQNATKNMMPLPEHQKELTDLNTKLNVTCEKRVTTIISENDKIATTLRGDLVMCRNELTLYKNQTQISLSGWQMIVEGIKRLLGKDEKV